MLWNRKKICSIVKGIMREDEILLSITDLVKMVHEALGEQGLKSWFRAAYWARKIFGFFFGCAGVCMTSKEAWKPIRDSMCGLFIPDEISGKILAYFEPRFNGKIVYNLTMLHFADKNEAAKKHPLVKEDKYRALLVIVGHERRHAVQSNRFLRHGLNSINTKINDLGMEAWERCFDVQTVSKSNIVNRIRLFVDIVSVQLEVCKKTMYIYHNSKHEMDADRAGIEFMREVVMKQNNC